MQLNNNDINESIYDIESQMKNLLREFEVVKGQLEPSSRHQLRDRFLQLAKNRFNNLTDIAILLADHAYKLQQRMFILLPSVRTSISLIALYETIIKTNKTNIHINLEKVIETNKQMIFRLMKNDNPTANEMVIINQLRDETRQLIRKLTIEMLCPQQTMKCNLMSECKFVGIL